MQAFLTYYIFQLGVGAILRWWFMLRALVAGRRFYCRALAGESTYNTSINSDLTVSCSCQDRNGSGELGDLNLNSFEEIWHGPVATRFRAQLARGVLPITWCSHCADRLEVTKEAAQLQITNYSYPKGVMVEGASACNLKCTSCIRTVLNRTRGCGFIKEPQMETASKACGGARVRMIHFLKLGEPFAAPNVLQQVESLRRYNPNAAINCSTNGMLIDTPEKREAALRLDFMVVSIDGPSTAVCNRYQVGMDFDRAYRNLCALVAERNRRGQWRPVIVWKYVLFWWNDRRELIESAMMQANGAGVDFIAFTPTLSPPWGISWRYRISPFIRSLGTFNPDFGTAVPVHGTPSQVAYWNKLMQGNPA